MRGLKQSKIPKKFAPNFEKANFQKMMFFSWFLILMPTTSAGQVGEPDHTMGGEPSAGETNISETKLA